MYEAVNVNRQTPDMADRFIVLDSGHSLLVNAAQSTFFPLVAQVRTTGLYEPAWT
jgi:hypothetical protein